VAQDNKPNPQFHFAKPLVERQHAVIEELRACSPRYVRGAQLAERTGTTIRTVERDLARLIEAGVPVEKKHGPGGGYRLDVPRTLTPISFTPGEASAIIASLVAIGPYISASAQSAFTKLLAAIAERTEA
jgi:predicted DNA-binding transcriptional regulator YafY